MNHIIIFTITSLLLMVSCEKKSSGHHSHHKSEHKKNETEHKLQLNDGKKWKMDEHTRNSLNKMTVLLENTEKKMLGKTLREELHSLIKGCTMTGAAHDELHKFLELYMPAIQKLFDEESEENLRLVKNLLELYPHYFE